MENLNEMGEYLNTEIVCTLAGLGYAEGNEYYKSPDCLESLKDLIRFLRRDDTTCEIRRQLGYAEVLQNDLVAILKSCSHKEREIFDMVIRLMVNLTQPAVLCFQNKIPDDKTGQHYYLDLVSQLQSYKEAFTEKEVMSVIGRELGRLLQMEWDDRLEEDSLLIERILLLIRNILHVPANRQAEKRTDDDASVHDQVIWNLHTNGIDDLLLFIASSPDERRWSMHILEIVSLMLREQNPESLAKAGDQRSRTEKKEDEKQLEILREQELAEKLKNARKFSGRHSRFGGTFYVQNMRAINDANQLIYHRPLAEVKNMTFDHNKTAPKKRKKQQLAKEMGEERRSTLSIRVFLKDFCRVFLRQCYNPLMNVVKDNIKHGQSQENDESYYLWCMRFFMEFSRHHNFRVDFVSETLSVVSFTDLLAIVTKLYDAYESNKAEASVWGRRLHLAVQAYKELMLNVLWMDKSEDGNLHENAKIIKGNIFYMSEYRDTLLLLLKKFNMTSQTKGYLRDLVDAFHIFLKMLEGYCAGKTHIVVKKKKRATKKKRRTSHAGASPSTLTPEQIEEKWQDLASDLSSTLQGHQGDIPEAVVPFDAASEIPVDEQKTNALSQIQSSLRNERCGEAVALLRAARDVWPNDQFGTADISAEDEFMCLYDIYRMDLLVVAAPQIEDGFNEGEDDDINPEEEEMSALETREAEFSVQDFFKKLATPAIVQPYTWLLKYYKENKDFTNHAIIKMLHRVAVDLKMPAMLFQMSLFCTFQKILHDPAGTHYKEMVKFARYIVGKFFEMLPKNPVLLVELAIWKNSGDCYEIMEGYGTLALRSASQNAATWTSEEGEELRQLYEEYKDSDDLVDKILENISNETRSRRQIINKLVALNLVTNRRELRKKAPKRSRWPEEEVEQLRALYEEYKNSEDDVVEKIMAHMLNASRTRRQVVIKLVQLGIVEDRKMLRKKRTKGEKRKKEVDDFINDNENESSDSDDSDMEEGFKAPPSSSDDSESDANGDDDIDETGDSLADQVRKLNESGLKYQVQWIKSKLLKTADDRESTDKEKWQPLPLVTITEESEEALSNKLFKQTLRKIGLVPPANEQEMFWRIPVSLNPEKLRKAADILDGKDSVGKDLADGTEHSTPPGDSKNSARRKKLAALAAERKKSGTASGRKRKERSRPGKEKTSRAKTWRQGLNERIADDDICSHSDGDSNDEGQKENAKESSPADDDGGLSKKERLKKTKHRVRALDDSDEEGSASINQSKSELKETNQSEGEGGGEKSDESDADDNGNMEDEDETANSVIKKTLKQSKDSDGGLYLSKDESDDIDDVNNNSTKDPTEVGKKRPRDEEDSSDDDGDDEEFNLPLSHHKKAKRVLIEDDED